MKKIYWILIIIFTTTSLFSNLIVSNYEHTEIIDFFVNPYNGEIATIGENYYVKTYDPVKKSINKYYKTSSLPTHVIWIMDNKYTLIAEESGIIEVFNNDSSLLNFLISVSNESITHISTFEDKVAFTSLDKTAYVYNITKRRLEYQRKFSTNLVSIKFYNSNSILIGDHQGNIHLIDYTNGNEINTKKIDNYSILEMDIVEDKILIFTMNGNVYLLNYQLETINSINIGQRIIEVSFSPNKDKFAVLTLNNTLFFYDSHTLQNTSQYNSTLLTPKSFDWNYIAPEYIYINNGSDIYSLNITTRNLEKVLELKKSDVVKLIKHDKLIYYLSTNNEIGILNTDSGKIVKNLSFNEEINDFIITKNQDIIICDNLGYVSIYDIEGNLKKSKKISDSRLTTLEISPEENYLVVGGWGNKIYVVNIFDLNIYKTVENLHNNWIQDISINSTGNRVAVSALDKRISVSTFPGFYLPTFIEDFLYIIWSIDWANNSNFLAFGGFDGTLHIWDARFENLYKKFEVVTSPINIVKWSPDDNYLATGTTAGIVYVWDFRSGSLKSIINVSNSEILDLFWSDDGRYLFVLSRGNLISLIDLQQTNVILQTLIFEKGYFVSYRKNGEYSTNIPPEKESNYFYKNRPISLFESVKFQRIDSINIRSLEAPIIEAPSEFLMTSRNNLLPINIFDSEFITKVRILDQTFTINSDSYYISMRINLEKLTSDVLEIEAFDSDGNRSLKTVHLRYEDIYVQVFTNQAEITNINNEVIAIANRGDILKLKGVLGDSYRVEYKEKEGFIKKAYVTLNTNPF